MARSTQPGSRPDDASAEATRVLPGVGALTVTPEAPLAAFVMRDAPSPVRADLHYHLEMGVVIAGGMRRDHGGGWFDLAPGQVWVAGSLEPHWWQYGPQGLHGLMFAILPSFLRQIPDLPGLQATMLFRSPLRSCAVSGPAGVRRALARMAAGLVPHHDRPDRPSGIIYADLVRVLEFISREYLAGVPELDAGVHERWGASRIRPALDLVEKSPGQLVPVADAAHACTMAPSTFRRVFKGVMSMTFSQFGLRRRLAAAAAVLRATDSPIKTVAYRFGFTDGSHFHRTFSTHYGVSPGRYRALPAEGAVRSETSGAFA